jgi:hypothetical protein
VHDRDHYGLLEHSKDVRHIYIVDN